MIEQHVTSLSLSKKLKELGVPQGAFWSWYETTDIDDTPRLNRTDENCPVCCLPRQRWEAKYSAFLSSELGEMLKPYSFYSNNICSDFPVWLPEKQKWGFMDDKPEWVYGDTEANTRALWLIYLIENGLLSPKQSAQKREEER